MSRTGGFEFGHSHSLVDLFQFVNLFMLLSPIFHAARLTRFWKYSRSPPCGRRKKAGWFWDCRAPGGDRNRRAALACPPCRWRSAAARRACRASLDQATTAPAWLNKARRRSSCRTNWRALRSSQKDMSRRGASAPATRVGKNNECRRPS